MAISEQIQRIKTKNEFTLNDFSNLCDGTRDVLEIMNHYTHFVGACNNIVNKKDITLNHVRFVENTFYLLINNSKAVRPDKIPAILLKERSNSI